MVIYHLTDVLNQKFRTGWNLEPGARSELHQKFHGDLLRDCREPPEQDSGSHHHQSKLYLSKLLCQLDIVIDNS